MNNDLLDTLPIDLQEVLKNSTDPKYINFVSNLPFNKSSEDILDIKRAAAVLDKNHFGLQSVKDRILEYLAVLILNKKQNLKTHAPILAFVGLVGSGKTSLALSVAEVLGRKLIRIPFGGLGNMTVLKGRSKVLPEAEPSLLLKEIAKAGVNNPVVLLDEIDRVSHEGKNDIMGVLVELLDPEQNAAYTDYYVDYPFDLSNVLFVATANNTGNISTAVMDRLEIIEMPSYSDAEKIIIGKQYLLPKAIRDAGLKEGQLVIDEAAWPMLVRPLGYDGGIRSLQRTIQEMVRKMARQVVEGNPGPFRLNVNNIGGYIQ